MFTNRFFSLLVIVALAVVAGLLGREAKATAAPVAEMDSATRSYIAWGEALEAAGKLGESGACSTPSQENIFAGIPSNVDSATRSYIAWGMALQAKDDIPACR
jgi:hypothetical protein